MGIKKGVKGLLVVVLWVLNVVPVNDGILSMIVVSLPLVFAQNIHRISALAFECLRKNQKNWFVLS